MGWLTFLKDYLSNFHKPSALVAWVAILVLFFAFVHNFLIGLLPVTYLPWVYLGIIIAVACFWCWKRFRLPRRVKNKLNIVIAIATEDEKDGATLKNDLVSKLREDLIQGGLGDMAHVIVLANHLAQRAKVRTDIDRMNKKVQGHLWIWGSARKRNGRTYLDLEGLVIHRPVGLRTQKALSVEFRQALPKRIEFSDNLSFQFSELSADMIYFTARYVTGVAALLSGDPNLALQLHSALRGQLAAQNHPLPPNLDFIENKLPVTISDAHLTKAFFHNERNEVEEARTELETALNTNPKSYAALTFRSILEFSRDNNPEAALATTERAERVATYDATWKYNKAFLLLWLGQYEEALKLCRSITRHSYQGEDGAVRDVELFNEKLIQGGHARPSVYFWLGHLYYQKNQNLPKALEYFEEFERRADASMQLLLAQSSAGIVDIKATMGLS